MNRTKTALLVTSMILASGFVPRSFAGEKEAESRTAEKTPGTQFEALLAADWKEVFFDPCTKDWKEKWTLDGEKAKIAHK